jgi:hypothetical protein
MVKILKQHWEQTLLDNENMILNSTITIEMAKEVINLCKRKIAAFPVVKAKEQKKPVITG